MSSNKDKVMKTLIGENLKLRNRIVQLERVGNHAIETRGCAV